MKKVILVIVVLILILVIISYIFIIKNSKQISKENQQTMQVSTEAEKTDTQNYKNEDTIMNTTENIEKENNTSATENDKLNDWKRI